MASAAAAGSRFLIGDVKQSVGLDWQSRWLAGDRALCGRIPASLTTVINMYTTRLYFTWPLPVLYTIKQPYCYLAQLSVWPCAPFVRKICCSEHTICRSHSRQILTVSFAIKQQNKSLFFARGHAIMISTLIMCNAWAVGRNTWVRAAPFRASMWKCDATWNRCSVVITTGWQTNNTTCEFIKYVSVV